MATGRRLLLCGVILLSGCAEVRSAARVRELTRALADLKERQRESQERQEELENRVLLLTDQLDSQRVAHGRRGSVDLPVVTLRPEAVAAAAPPPALVTAGEPRVPVEFAGAARSEEPERIRPLLRAEGDSFAAALNDRTGPASLEPPPRAEGRRAPTIAAARRARPAVAASLPGGSPPLQPATAPPPLPMGGDNLGVVPVPRIAALPSAGAPAPRPAAAPSVAALPASPARAASDGEPMALYRTAYDHLRGGRYTEAERDLREFVRRFPRHDYADNAEYWLGETFYARKVYPDAASAFRAVVERWPAGNKAPDALLKLGFTLLMMGDTQKGRAVLQQVSQHYPNTEAARLADRRLAEVKESE